MKAFLYLRLAYCNYSLFKESGILETNIMPKLLLYCEAVEFLEDSALGLVYLFDSLVVIL